jgi:FMN hydrolase / 5-amino-6-(5-phospho-D-ribitylamino)uracil phosphatase
MTQANTRLDLKKIKAITLDLDDTLWPIVPVMLRAEKALSDWLKLAAPMTAALMQDVPRRLALRQQIQRELPQIGHDLGALRRELIRRALQQNAEDTKLAEPAYQVFMSERMKVTLYEDAIPALDWLAQRFPLVAVSNGNADVRQVGLGAYFKASLSAQDFGIGKPDSRIFHAAALAVGVSTEAVLHVGDDAVMDILGALEAGMQTVWLNREGHDWTHEEHPHAKVTELTQLCAILQPAA